MTEPQQIAFTIARFRNVRPDDLVTKWSGTPMTAALIFTPNECLVARVEKACLYVVKEGDREQKPAALSAAYEIRAFGPDAELRWTREGTAGEATLFADGTVTVAGSEMLPESEKPTYDETLDVLWRTYRVWGEPPKSKRHVPDGWLALSAGQIGTIYVPSISITAREIILKAKEYVVSGECGNAVVLFERLVGFEAADARG